VGNQKKFEARFSLLGERSEDPVISDLMASALSNPQLLSLAAGFTDNAVLPVELIGQLIKDLVANSPDAEFLQYGTTQGRPLLREHIIKFLATYPDEESLAVTSAQVVITNGSQQSLYLAAQVLCDPGDIILVERPSYFVFLEMLKGLGIKAVSMPTLESGRIDFVGLRELLDRMAQAGQTERLKAIYLVTYYSNPSSLCMYEEDKRGLGSLVQSLDYRLPVIEDAAYRELYYEDPWPSQSILSLPEFQGLSAMYAGTFTKPFATGLKVGYAVCTDCEWLSNMVRFKAHHDFGTANFNQAIIERMLTQEKYPDLLKNLRAHYLPKMRLLERTLEEQGLAELGWVWDSPQGGLLLWLRGPAEVDTGIQSAFSEACIREGVMYVPGDLCFADPAPTNTIRLSIGSLADDDLQEAARRFVKVARSFE